MTDADATSGPMAGVRVIELAGIGPAQHGVMLLADLGADVVRIDRPAERPEPGGVLDRGRRSICLDLKQETDLATARELIGDADVLVDPYRPGVLERIGLDPADLRRHNPRLIVARMTGWGQTGPLAAAAGHDLNYIGLSGALEAIGEPDRPPPVPLNVIADFGGGGMLLAFAVATALHERTSSDTGQVIDVAMVDGVASLMSGVLHLRSLGQWDDRRGGGWLQGAAPWYRAYRTADDRYVTVGPLEAKFYEQLLVRLGLDPDEWPQWDERLWPALGERFAEIFAGRSRDEWRAELEGTDVCFAPALSLQEAARDPHLRSRGTYFEADGTMHPGPVPRFDRTPASIRTQAPLPGEHADEIVAELQDRRRRRE